MDQFLGLENNNIFVFSIDICFHLTYQSNSPKKTQVLPFIWVHSRGRLVGKPWKNSDGCIESDG